MPGDIGFDTVVKGVLVVGAVLGAVGFGLKHRYWPTKTPEDKWREQSAWGRQIAAEITKEHQAKKKKRSL